MGLPPFTDGFCARHAVRLITILAGAGRRAEAEQVRDRALAVLDAPQIRRAIEVTA